MEKNNKDNIFAQIILEQSHLNYVNQKLEEIYDNIGEYTETEEELVYMLNNEKDITINKIRELKVDYANIIKEESTTVSGKIEIEYKDIPDEIRFYIYRFLNKCVIDNPGVSYRTVENETYSKDFPLKENSKDLPLNNNSKDFSK